MERFKNRFGNEVEAVRWLKNGDHPDDDCKMITRLDGSEPFLSEGKVVRRYRRPDVDGQTRCPQCRQRMDDHGWIDTGKDGISVCPGDWVLSRDGVYWAQTDFGMQLVYVPLNPELRKDWCRF